MSEREKLIKDAAKAAEISETYLYYFEEGARWADANPEPVTLDTIFPPWPNSDDRHDWIKHVNRCHTIHSELCKIQVERARNAGYVDACKKAETWIETAVKEERARIKKTGFCSGCHQEYLSYCGWCGSD